MSNHNMEEFLKEIANMELSGDWDYGDGPTRLDRIYDLEDTLDDLIIKARKILEKNGD